MAHNRTFRVFISSTFEDFQTERELLRARVWPELENYCKLRGATFEAIDLRWGIPANSAEDLDIVSICLDEVERCQKLSPRPNFIAMIGDRYGWRPLPANIPENVFELLPLKAKNIVIKHYELDKNANPANYLLSKKTIDDPGQENEIILQIRTAIGDNYTIPELDNFFFKSATHLEIDEGIFKPRIQDMEDHFFACFRNIREFSKKIKNDQIDAFSKKFIDIKQEKGLIHDVDAAVWLNKLRDDIRSILKDKPGQIENYQTSLKDLSANRTLPYMENMCLDIELWLKNKISEELAEVEKTDSLEIEKLAHQKFKDIRNQTFGGRELLLKELKQKINRSVQRNVICIHGEGGCGKSALLARLISETESEFSAAATTYRFVGATPDSIDLNSLLGGIIDESNANLHTSKEIERVSREEHVAAFNNFLNQQKRKEKTIIFIDALDQLNNTGNAHSLYWLPQEVDENMVLVLSVLNGHVFNSLKKIYPDAAYFDLSPKKRKLEDKEAESMLKALLSKKPARRLQRFQVDYILNSFQKNPLMLNLKLIAENARHWHSFDSVAAIENKHIGIKEDVNEQIKLLFERWSKDDNYGSVFIKNVLALIALSREGISDKEIKDILWKDDAFQKEFDERKHVNQPEVDSLPPIVWSRFFFEIEPFLMEKMSGGTVVYDFFHRLFKVVIKSGITNEESVSFHKLMESYFNDPKVHPIRFITQNGGEVYNIRKLTELPFHQSKAGLLKNAYETLTDFIFLNSKVNTGKTFELMEDFQLALELDRQGEYPLLNLIIKAFRNDINFIARHPESFFQSLYNSCWWYDHPEKSSFYKNADFELAKTTNNLYTLMEKWEKAKSSIYPGFYWLRALQPPSVELDGPQIGLLIGLSSPVTFASFSIKGDKIYAVCNRGELITWNAETLNIEQFLPFAVEKSFMFKPNSKKRFNEFTEIMADKGGVLADHPGFEYWAWSGIISPNGKLFLSGSFDGDVMLWEFSEKGNEKFNLKLDGDIDINQSIKRPVRGLAFSKNNAYAATGHGDGSLVIWDINHKKSIDFLQHDEGWINSVALDRDGDRAVSGGGDGHLYIWEKDKSSGKFKRAKLTGHTDRIWVVALSADGKYAASGSDDKTVRIWDLNLKKELKCLLGHTRWVQALAFSNNSEILASSGGDGKILLWSVSDKNIETIKQYSGHDDSVLSLSFSSDDKYLLSGSRDQSVRIWNVQSEIAVSEKKGHSDRITCAAFSKDGQLLVTGSNDMTIRLWDAGSGKPIGDDLEISVSVSAIKFSPDSRYILVGGDNGEVIVVDKVSLSIVRRIKLHESRVYSLDISSDSKLVMSASQDGEVKLWHLRTVELFAEKKIENESILSVSLSPDYSFAAIGTRSGLIKILEIKRDLRKSFVLVDFAKKKLFKTWVDEIAYSMDGSKIEARGGSWDDRKILLIDAKTLELVHPEKQNPDGAIGSFGKYPLGFGSVELTIKGENGEKEIAWYPKALEFSSVHPAKRQWAGVQRYNLHHFRLEGGK
jgi:WD40 repeat protein/archaellum biogenesis ATPase FlaH